MPDVVQKEENVTVGNLLAIVIHLLFGTLIVLFAVELYSLVFRGDRMKQKKQS